VAVPDFQTIMRPILEAVASGAEPIGVVVERVSEKFSLSALDREELLPSGRQTKIANRVHWARLHMIRAGLLVSAGRGRVTVTERGRAALIQAERIDLRYLARFPEYQAFRAGTSAPAPDLTTNDVVSLAFETPEEDCQTGRRSARQRTS
jgi:restriction system protein